MLKAKKELFSRPKIFFYILTVGIFIFVALYFAEIKKDIKLFGKVNAYWLVAAVLGQVCTYFIGSLIYRQLLNLFNIKLRLSIWKLFQASIITLFFNQTVPSAGVSGNTFFFNFLRKRNIPVDDIFSLIFIELLTFYLAMIIIIIAVTVINFLFYKASSLFTVILICGFLVYLTFGVAICLLGRKGTISSIFKKLESIKIFRRLVSRLKKTFSDISFDSIKSPWPFLLQNKTGILIATLLQSCIFLADSFTIYALFQGLGISITLLLVSTGLTLTKIISILPFSPGALILYEGAMTFFFSKLGVNSATAIVVTLLYRALSFWLPILVGLFLYRKLQIKEK